MKQARYAFGAMTLALTVACAGTPAPEGGAPKPMAAPTVAAAPAKPAAPAAAPAAPAAAPAAPQVAAAPQPPPEYVAIKMEIDVAKSAADTWAKVGKYCDLGTWLKIDCVISSGDGGIGTVRKIAAGRVTEVLTAITPLSYGYTQPAVPGRFYDLYHGFLEARPTGANTSKLYYTLMLDVSNRADQAAKDADVKRRRTQFEGALAEMKKIAEAK